MIVCHVSVFWPMVLIWTSARTVTITDMVVMPSTESMAMPGSTDIVMVMVIRNKFYINIISDADIMCVIQLINSD